LGGGFCENVDQLSRGILDASLDICFILKLYGIQNNNGYFEKTINIPRFCIPQQNVRKQVTHQRRVIQLKINLLCSLMSREIIHTHIFITILKILE
jgi:hypothetical protein